MPLPPRQSSTPPIPFGPAPTSRVVSTKPIPDILSSSRPSEPVLDTITSPFGDDDTGGGSCHESPPRPPPATPTLSPTVGVVEEPLTLTSLLTLFPTCLQRIATLEAELNATKILHRDTMVLFAKRIKKLENKLKTEKRKLVLSDSKNEEEARQSKELDALLDLANAALHEPSPSTTPSKPANPEQSSEQETSPTTLDAKSSSGLDFTDADIPADGLDSAGGVDSAGGLTSAGISVAAGPNVPAEPSSPLRDPSKGKAELKQNIDDEQVYLDSLLAQRVAEEQDRESIASATQSTHRQAELDRVALNLTNEECIGLIVYEKIRRAVDLATAKDHHQHITRSGEPLESSESKKLKSSHSTTQPAELQETTSISAGATIAAGDPIPAVTSVSTGFPVSAASSIPATTPIAAGVSTTVGAFGSASEASVPIIELLDSPPKDTSLPLDPETEEQDAPLRKSSRKKSISKKRTLPSPSKPKSDALPFDEDDPGAAFKRYLRQASDDDEHVEPVSLSLVSNITTWEIIPTEFGLGEMHVITRADGTVKRFSTVRELMYWAGRADLMVLYGLVSDRYKTERATSIGLGLWIDLRTLITAREERDASIIWDDQDQWQIQS
nr:hypothetical protein [Tanacetum cinerariifolium]